MYENSVKGVWYRQFYSQQTFDVSSVMKKTIERKIFYDFVFFERENNKGIHF